MDELTYLELLHRITPAIQQQDTNMRKAITPHERLSITLRYLATGLKLQDLKFSNGKATCALSIIIPQTCYAIYETLKKDYLEVSKHNII